MENKPAITKVFLGISLGLLIIMIGLSFYSPVNRAVQKGERINLLLIGCDETENSKRADVLMFVSFYPRQRLADILSIPRDSRVRVPKYKLLRINEFFAYGFKKGGIGEGIALTKEVTQNLLGLEIPYYIQLDFNDLISIVDALGGVTLDITEKMDYDDNWGNLHIHFKPGRQTLNGKQSLEYLRFRKDLQGDIGRMQRNRSFIRALAAKIKSPAIIFRMPQLAWTSMNALHTDLGLYDLVTLIFELRKLNTQNFRQQQLPGKPVSVRGAWVWEIDKIRLEKVTQLLREDPVANDNAAANIRVEIWNATRNREAVEEVTKYLRQKGVDVLTWGNFERILPHTKIIDRTGNIDSAHYLGKILHCDEIETSLSDSSLTQAVIIIGEDWRQKIAL
ncbi:MAG: LCP family protein [bacterium]|nr:LCP family protein [bacterium]MDD5353705.1 LCP family protein [bacterium]MDD5755673.1 LCP family protein [bacterium]